MNTDIRLSVGFFSHPKTIKLMRRTGAEGVVCIQRLWIWAAQNRVDGCLEGFEVDDIEIVAGWTGEPGAFVQTLGDLRFLDRNGDAYCLHGWSEHQEYVTQEPARIERARKAAQKRWGNASSNAGRNANDSNTAMLDDATSNASSNASSNAGRNAPNQTKPNQEENTSPPVDNPVNEDPARSPERRRRVGGKTSPPDGEAPAVAQDEPGIEFVELREAYNAVRPEGPLAGFAEYRQLKAARDRTGRSLYPGNFRLMDDFTARMSAGFWNPGYALGLAQYLKTRLWEQPVKARASPGPAKSWQERESEANIAAFLAEP